MAPFIAAILPTLAEAIGKIIPDPQAAAEAKIRLAELAQKGDLAELDASVRLAAGQMEINKAEASAPLGAFRAGWRPSLGYVGVAAIAFQYLVNPLLIWGNVVFGWSVTPPHIDIDAHLWELIMGMVGLAMTRSYDKRHGKDS